MEEKNLEQVRESQPENTDNCEMTSNTFASASELEKAYNHLRAEFTRKSQRLSELEKVAADANASVAVDKGQIIAEYLKQVASREHPAIISHTNAEVTNSADKVIKTITETTKEVENFFINRRI